MPCRVEFITLSDFISNHEILLTAVKMYDHHVLIGENPYPKTPAMASGIADHVWAVEEIVKLIVE